ncbi:MAG: glycosyl transferase [Neptuniibacter caesariensis]|uniref:Glycosyl transferase n=1 Tax=Neptuniibacter caesariensis TaxID=207954 RepID=A0A2G6JB02_NEPCE|nr:MAG: glycosyl transferase [Neptuniibacter caesariensis]
MNIVIFKNSYVPALKYGGTERVVYYLALELQKLGHNVTLLVRGLTQKSEVNCITYDENLPLAQQLPQGTEIVHLHEGVSEELPCPYVITMHGNLKDQRPLDKNTIFVSKNHAERFGSSSFVLNGLDWSDYSAIDWRRKRDAYHFLGKAAWRIKNVKGAIDIAVAAKEKMNIIGGYRFNFKMGVRFTLTPQASFYGMVGGVEKDQLLNGSKGLIFPILWNEPFGLAVTESLYFGAPVFATPYGSLSELVDPQVGFLSTCKQDLINAVKSNTFDPEVCHEYANDLFNSKIMALEYLKKYERVLNGHVLNEEEPFLQEVQSTKYLPFT